MGGSVQAGEAVVTVIYIFPSLEVRSALSTLRTYSSTADEEVDAAILLVRSFTSGVPCSYLAGTLALSALYRHRDHHKALVLAEKLAKVNHPEARLLGLGLVREQGSLTDLEVGLVLLGG